MLLFRPSTRKPSHSRNTQVTAALIVLLLLFPDRWLFTKTGIPCRFPATPRFAGFPEAARFSPQFLLGLHTSSIRRTSFIPLSSQHVLKIPHVSVRFPEALPVSLVAPKSLRSGALGVSGRAWGISVEEECASRGSSC